MFFSIEIGKTEFSFLINGSDNSSKYQRIHFNEFQDKIIVANNFTYKNMLECKIGCLGPQRGLLLPWATQQMTNNGRSFALPITVKKSVLKCFCSA